MKIYEKVIYQQLYAYFENSNLKNYTLDWKHPIWIFRDVRESWPSGIGLHLALKMLSESVVSISSIDIDFFEFPKE